MQTKKRRKTRLNKPNRKPQKQTPKPRRRPQNETRRLSCPGIGPRLIRQTGPKPNPNRTRKPAAIAPPLAPVYMLRQYARTQCKPLIIPFEVSAN